ncbi:MAG: fumarylacetoacetate hydrolase family protein [Alphaproteobacteria bacterium]|nr:fumarylacetoacetate hydrolase family protein [Alphaproteobacteria bacterium]
MIVRFRIDSSAEPRVGLMIGDKVHDLSPRYPTVRSFVAAHPDGWTDDPAAIGGTTVYPAARVHLLPPVDDGAGIYLVAANYKKHAEEAGLEVPQAPVIFMKPTTALVGAGEPIHLPPISREMDYEGELAAVIGRTATRIDTADAPRHVAGLTVVNDVTARDLQWVMLGKNRIVDWLSAKALDRSTPIGPGIVSLRGRPGPHALRLTTDLNGERMQDSETSLMVFSIWELVAFLSARVTLRPGDVLSTGTPVGVGGFRKIFLKAGDVVRVAVDGVGALENRVVQD